MERNMDLIRNILLEIERKEDGLSWVELSFEQYSSEETNYHVRLLSDAAFIGLISTWVEVWFKD